MKTLFYSTLGGGKKGGGEGSFPKGRRRRIAHGIEKNLPRGGKRKRRPSASIREEDACGFEKGGTLLEKGELPKGQY